jgi:hypothetical protein
MKPSEHREFLASLERTRFPYEVWLGEVGDNLVYKTAQDYLANVDFSPITAGDYESFGRLFGKKEFGNFIALKPEKVAADSLTTTVKI